MIKNFKKRWYAESGYKEVLALSLPLILSTSSTTIQHFVDRMFLTWYSPEAIAASVPGGILSFTLMCFFIGTATYTNTFVAQYFGAKQYRQISRAVWQGIYFAIISSSAIILYLPLARPIFELVGHDPAVRELEIVYFRILCLGAPAIFMSAAISGFFSGRGETWTIFWANAAATIVNILLDYLLIFGYAKIPSMGIKGAGYATVAANYTYMIILFALMLKPEFLKIYGTWKNKQFDFSLFRRLMRFGIPNGIHFMLDLTGFALFVLFVGRFGTEALAATNITFNINSFAFMPMIGMGIAVEIIVGQRLGENNPQLASFGTTSALHITLFYMSIICATYIFLPQIYLFPFAAKAGPQQFERVAEITVKLLYFVAFYSVFDTMNIIYSNALRGAGDTKFVMFTSVTLSWILMIIPTYLGSVVYNWGIYITWFFITAYIVALGIAYYLRYIQGKWKSMRVIEESPLALSPSLPEDPAMK